MSEPQIQEIEVKTDFYKDYIGINFANLGLSGVNNFQERLDKRLEHVKTMFGLSDPKWTNDKIIEENFVEIFCWSVFPKQMLDDISDLLRRNNIFYIIDPCCGNNFHIYLFTVFAGFIGLAIDIQPEPYSWAKPLALLHTDTENTPTTNGLVQMPYYSKIMHDCGTYTYNKQCLFLSWIDRDDLAMSLINSFKGAIIISIGHLENVMIETCKHLDTNFELLRQYNLKMPWDIVETVKVYKRKG